MRTKKADLGDDDAQHKRTFVGYGKRHLGQEPSGDTYGSSRWRYPLINWGHDPESFDPDRGRGVHHSPRATPEHPC